MNALELLAQESPLKQATPQARQLVDNLRQAICLEYGINPGTNELVFHFGVLSDKCNGDAIDSWVYLELRESDEREQSKIFEGLYRSFERRLDTLCTTH